MLVPDEPPPEIVAFLEAAVATVYKHVFDMVIQEIDEPEFAQVPSWRQLVADAAGQTDSIDQVPKATSGNKDEWETIVDCLADDVMRDRDFELQLHLDADPDKSRGVKEMMGISEDYYTAVAHDPPDDQVNLYLDALKGLTPCGRGESFEQDDSDLSGDHRF